ncbi:hypothetical protein CEXT_253671 [Caerostris extrusa]|uniref:Uncharacterized protein n=1 Tax=Caerostris extrusa TaxID=172846 RepID=A0AAV4Q9M2_CAEEX|nr:hypothetical protein CEXT_253671 [Caerostris extrusa]
MYEASGTLVHIDHCLPSFSGMHFPVSPVTEKKEKKHRPPEFSTAHYHDSVNPQRVRDRVFGATEVKIKGDSFHQIMEFMLNIWWVQLFPSQTEALADVLWRSWRQFRDMLSRNIGNTATE